MGTPTPGPAAAASPAQRIPSWLRIPKVFYSPGEVFEDIARAPHFILCLAVEIAIGVLVAWLAVHRIGAMNIALNAIKSNPMAQSLSAAQRAQQAATAARFIRLSPAMAVIGTLLLWVILAAILLGAENFGLGQQTQYKQMLGVAAHGLLPLSLAGVLSAIVVLGAPRGTDLNIQNLIGSNLGYYLDPHTSPWLLALGQRLDLFSFWVIGLLALGLQKAGTKVKYGSALSIMLLLWGVWVLAMVGIAALRS